MKHQLKLILFLLFVFVCFISVSAISGEDPWDADQRFSQSSGNSNSLSTSTESDNIMYVNYFDSPLDILFNIAFNFVMWSSNDQLRTDNYSRELKKGIRIR